MKAVQPGIAHKQTTNADDKCKHNHNGVLPADHTDHRLERWGKPRWCRQRWG